MIECIRFKSHVKGDLQGFADLYIPEWDIEIPGFTMWMKDGRRWISAPGVEYKNQEGETKYRPLFFFKDKSKWRDFTREALKAVDKHCQLTK